MTALSIDDDLYRRAAEVASTQGKTVDRFVGEAVEWAIGAAGVRRTSRNGLPVVAANPPLPTIDPALVRQFLEEEGI